MPPQKFEAFRHRLLGVGGVPTCLPASLNSPPPLPPQPSPYLRQTELGDLGA